MLKCGNLRASMDFIQLTTAAILTVIVTWKPVAVTIASSIKKHSARPGRGVKIPQRRVCFTRSGVWGQLAALFFFWQN